MNLNDNTPVFYIPGRPGIIDLAIMRDGVYVGGYSGEAESDLNKRYPGVILGRLGPVVEQSDDHFRAPPVEITQERYIEMLEVLPPDDWRGVGSAEESFKLSERTSGIITAIFCRIGERYFEMSDSVFMKHDEIAKRCRMMLEPIFSLTCCCCGTSTTGRQWHNRDTGYGLCQRCIERCTHGEPHDEIVRRYGLRGIHYDLPA